MEKIKNSISVITVCYNCKDDLELTINSVLSQTYNKIEFIVVDGGSKDGTKDVLEKYRDRIDVCISEPDNGIYDAMNKGIAYSSGEWLIFMNAGDRFCDVDVLEKVFSSELPHGAEFLYSDYYFHSKVYGTLFRRTDRNVGVIHHQSAIYKRSLHDKYGYYVVTHPYIVSDLMFFLAVPAEKYFKVNVPIATIEDAGVSAQNWSRKQALCLKYIYGLVTFRYLLLDWVKMSVSSFLRKLHLRK